MANMFAFTLASPVRAADGPPVEATYDAAAQLAVWRGGQRPLSVTCTRYFWGQWHRRHECSAYGSWCQLSGYNMGKYECDW